MDNTTKLILAIKNCMQNFDGQAVRSENDFVQKIKKYLVEQKYEVKTDLKLPVITRDSASMPFQTKRVDIVVKVHKEYVPIEVKYNREMRDYKREVSQIQYYVQNYIDVPCSLAMFLSRATQEKDIYNLTWKSSIVDKQSSYIIAKYATVRGDNRIFIRKNSHTGAMASAWNSVEVK